MTMEKMEETEENSLNSVGTPVVVDDDTIADSGDTGE